MKREESITLPLYDANDIDSCMKPEYTLDETSVINTIDMSNLYKFAGPKGDFYGGHGYGYDGELILDENRLPLLNVGDYIKLSTMLDDHVDIKYGTTIKVNQN
jgi:hypothetical protein